MKKSTESNIIREISHHHCEKHGCPMVIYSTETDSREFCEVCEMEERQQRSNEKIQQGLQFKNYADYGQWLYRHSIVDDGTIKLATFDNYNISNPSQNHAKTRIVELMKMMRNGERFNVALHGNAGTGKSHLSFAMLKELNNSGDVRCLFINVASLFTRLRSTYNGSSQFNEHDILERIKKADYVVLDDLGSEVGRITTETRASDYVVRVLYEILNARQGKVTIWNTNLSTKTLDQLYDRKIISRLFLHAGDKAIRFDWKDARMYGPRR